MCCHVGGFLGVIVTQCDGCVCVAFEPLGPMGWQTPCPFLGPLIFQGGNWQRTFMIAMIIARASLQQQNLWPKNQHVLGLGFAKALVCQNFTWLCGPHSIPFTCFWKHKTIHDLLVIHFDWYAPAQVLCSHRWRHTCWRTADLEFLGLRLHTVQECNSIHAVKMCLSYID